jgi:hypothetical protein
METHEPERVEEPGEAVIEGKTGRVAVSGISEAVFPLLVYSDEVSPLYTNIP